MASEGLSITGAAYGTDSDLVSTYLEEIQVECIDTLITKLQETEDLFTKIRQNWAGKAEENFEKNFTDTIEKLKVQIKKAGDDLKSEISEVSSSMIKMDENLID